MEAELWFLLFYVAKMRGAKTMLINARISDRSYKSYKRFSWLYRKIFEQIDEVYAQSEKDKKRLMELGAKNVAVTGNIKLAQNPMVTRKLKKPSQTVVTAASTHEGEEEPILKAYLKWRRAHPESKLIIVPRHPERFEKVFELAKKEALKEGLDAELWSSNESLESDIVVVDRMGELINFYAISDIVILGGAFAPVGGHNPVEVTPFECALISGKHIFNQEAIFSEVEGTIFCEEEGLQEALEEAVGARCVRLKREVSLEQILKGISDVV